MRQDMDSAGKRLLAAAREMRETVRQDMDSVEIPEDIRETAKRVWNEEDWSAHGAMELIARAILAERERCAKIVEGYADGDWQPEIAAAIRKGEAP
jgi:hypothetical protein